MQARLVLATVVAGSVAACGPATLHSTVDGAPSPSLMAEFWVDPPPGRDLYLGPWGARHAPDPRALFTFESDDQGGFSPKWDVTGPGGRKWSVKMGDEAQSEVTASRLLWALGYHQPPNYYLPLSRIDKEGTVGPIGPARYRPDVEGLDKKGEWAWRENPFVRTQPYRGLLVLLMMLNSTDLKDDNNSIYELNRPRDGARRWYVVRDVGSSLGETGWTPNRNDVGAFERAPFIVGVEDGYLRFEDHGRHSELLMRLTPADAAWTARRLRRLTPRQWHDAFRAGGYDRATTERYLARLREKIDQALAVAARPADAQNWK